MHFLFLILLLQSFIMHERIKFSCLNFRHPIKNDTKIVKNKNNLLFCSDIECKNLNLLSKDIFTQRK